MAQYFKAVYYIIVKQKSKTLILANWRIIRVSTPYWLFYTIAVMPLCSLIYTSRVFDNVHYVYDRVNTLKFNCSIQLFFVNRYVYEPWNSCISIRIFAVPERSGIRHVYIYRSALGFINVEIRQAFVCVKILTSSVYLTQTNQQLPAAEPT